MSHGPQLNLGVTYEPSVRTTYGARVNMQLDQFSTGRTTEIAQGTVAWNHKLVRNAEIYVAAGAAGVQTWDQVPTITAGVLPVAQAGAKVRRRDLTFALDLMLAPFTDPRLGTVFEQAGGTLSGEWRPRGDIAVRARSGVSWSVAGDNLGNRTLLAEATASYRDHKNELSFGVRAADVELLTLNQRSFEVGAFVGVTVAGVRAP
jgi:hypothetical protein